MSITLIHMTLTLEQQTGTPATYIISAAFLPDGHLVRNVLALATVEGYLNCDDHKFSKGSSKVPSFSADLLVAVKTTLKSMRRGDSSVTFTEPISGEKLALRISE
jgi:hypothetical protein